MRSAGYLFVFRSDLVVLYDNSAVFGRLCVSTCVDMGHVTARRDTLPYDYYFG